MPTGLGSPCLLLWCTARILLLQISGNLRPHLCLVVSRGTFSYWCVIECNVFAIGEPFAASFGRVWQGFSLTYCHTNRGHLQVPRECCLPKKRRAYDSCSALLCVLLSWRKWIVSRVSFSRSLLRNRRTNLPPHHSTCALCLYAKRQHR